MPKDEAKTVPPRNDLKKVEVYAVSRAAELQGKDPSCHYQWMSTDPSNSVGYYGKYTRRHELGDLSSGYAAAEPWEFVSSNEVTAGRPRDDQGKPIDTAMRHGDLVLMKTTSENYEVYQEIERRRDAANARRLRSDKATVTDTSGGVATHTHAMGVGFSGSHTELLAQEGA